MWSNFYALAAQAAPAPEAAAPGIAGVTTYQVISRDGRLPVPDVRVYPFRWGLTALLVMSSVLSKRLCNPRWGIVGVRTCHDDGHDP